MCQDTDEHEDHVDDVQAQVEAAGHEVVDDVSKAQNQGQDPQDFGMLDAVSGNLDVVSTFFLIDQQAGIDADSVLLVGMHHPVQEGHQDQDGDDHAQVCGMEDRVGDRHAEGDAANGGLAGNGQRDGTGQTGMPNDEAGVGGGDQQTIVHGGNLTGDLAGQQSAGDQAEAPVQPAAETGHESDQQDGGLVAVCDVCDRAQDLFNDRCGSERGAENDDHDHLHGEGQQAPEAGIITPIYDHVDDAVVREDQRQDEHDERQDDCEQKCVGQPTVDDLNEEIGNCSH